MNDDDAQELIKSLDQMHEDLQEITRIQQENFERLNATLRILIEVLKGFR